MTIKEVETRTGLARANIRYYEGEGFFTAARGENGYRDYSGENVDVLLKVKLLRQLGFSLEDIHALQAGEQSLGAALEQRAAGLEQESRELSRAAQLCRDMRTEGADFYTLDARRYLDRLAKEEEILAKDRDPVRIFPWRRMFAREIDYLLCLTVIVVTLQLFARMNIVRVNGNGGSFFLLHLGTLVLLLGMETLSLTLTGTTPGKFLFGLKILREDGSKLDFAGAGQRTVYVLLFYGFAQTLLGCSILLLSIGGAAMLIWACWQVYHERPLFWETDQLYLDGSTREQRFWDNHWNYLRVAGCLAVWAACIGLMVGGHILISRPLHRGADLTAEEFVENYNRYMAFTYGEENLSKRLRPDGTFEEIERPGTAVIHIFGDDTVPGAAFRFTQRDGRLTEVTLTRKYDSGGPLAEGDAYGVGIPYDEIYVAMRSLLWSRLGEKGVNSAYNDLTAGKGNYLGVLNGVQINSEMRFTGYHSFGEDALFAETGEEQSYFVEFVMELT